MTRQKQNRQLANNCTLGIPKKLKIEIVIFGTQSQPMYTTYTTPLPYKFTPSPVVGMGNRV